MQKPYGEGVAGHTGPESCGVSGNTDTEALTGVRTPLKRDLRQAWVLSSERYADSSVDGLQLHGKQHFIYRDGEGYGNSTESETPSMYRDTLSGNREALHLALKDCEKVRIENPKGVLL